MFEHLEVTIPSLRELRKEFRCRPLEGGINLAGYDAAATPLVEGKAQAKEQLDDELAERLFDQHELLFANEQRAVLLVLQGTDCSGKNGTIKHVVNRVNPAGVLVSEFAEPTEEEQARHFLWRYRQRLPAPGQLGVFARSHYEDVLVPSATGTLSPEQIEGRIEEVNAFERELVDSGVVLVKCMLHISYDEQRERFLRRLRRDDKRWKFEISDLDNRALWDEYQVAYAEAMAATSPEHAPWLVIPSDHKWYRNWAVASVLVATLEEMDMAYPQPDLDIEDIRARLEPPN